MSRSRMHSRSSYRGTYAGPVAYQVRQPATPEGPGAARISLRHLGFVLGTGIFVGLGVATGVAGAGALPAIALAAVVAGCNGRSTALLFDARSGAETTTPLPPPLGFAGGWMLVCAKTTCAATAALGIAGYLLMAFDTFEGMWRIPVALSALGILSMPILAGLRRPAHVNTVIAVAALGAVGLLALAGFYGSMNGTVDLGAPFAPSSWTGTGLAPIWHATAVMIVAYAGLGRRTADRDAASDDGRAVIAVVTLAATIYLVVAAVAIGTIGPRAIAEATGDTGAPLFGIGHAVTLPAIARVMGVGAVIAMAGMLWNLLFDLAHLLEILGHRGRRPDIFARSIGRRSMSAPAVALSALAVAALVLTRDVRLTWSLSAFTLLLYYAIANVAAVRLPAESRRYPRGFPLAVLGTCLTLAFSLGTAIWLTGLGLLASGIAWQWLTSPRKRQGGEPPRVGNPTRPHDAAV